MVYHRNLSDSKSHQISRTLLSILADLNNAVVWMILILTLIFNSSSSLSKSLGIVLSALATIGVIVIFMFHRFLHLWQGPSISHLFAFFHFSLCGPLELQNSLDTTSFFLANSRSGLLAEIMWSVCIAGSQRIFVRLILLEGFCFVHIPFLVVLLTYNFLSVDYLLQTVMLSFYAFALVCSIHLLCN